MESFSKPPADPSPSNTASTPSASTGTIQKSYSCVLCAQRKVKCDKSPGGCANCTKARVACIYKAPAPPRRRKRGMRELDINTKLKLYEDALRKLGVDPADVEQESFNASRKGSIADALLEPAKEQHENIETGMLLSEEGKSRYLENNLWTSLRGEFRDTKDILHESSDEEQEVEETDGSSPGTFSDNGTLLFGTPRLSKNIKDLHPQAVQIFRLWQTFLDNVNPLVKVFHTPTIQQTILNSTGNLHSIPKNLEALMFAIYCAAVASISDPECTEIMGESKAAVTRRFRTGAQQALLNANFLKSSDMMVLQAYVLFLLSLNTYDPRVLWILTGTAARLAQRCGLHRDGELLGLPPFEVEMRRRLWWQILMLDGFAEKLAGTGSLTGFYGDTKMPSNLNDSDLFQGMKELPKEHQGATEMMFFLIRCHVGQFLKKTRPKGTFDGVWSTLSGGAISVASKDKALDEFEETLNRKFLNYCDESIPWHFMCAYLSRAVVCTLRFIAHSPDQYRNKGITMSQKERDLLFHNCLRIITYQNYAFTSKTLQGFIWHVNMHFQWKAFIYMLSELRYRHSSQEVENAWGEIQKVYDFHPNFKQEMAKRSLPVAVGDLTLKAWESYSVARNIQEEPYYIHILRSQRDKTTPSSENTDQSQLKTPQPGFTIPPTQDKSGDMPAVELEQAFDPLKWNDDLVASLGAPQNLDPGFMDFAPSQQMNWGEWENLLQDFQFQENDGGFEGPVASWS